MERNKKDKKNNTSGFTPHHFLMFKSIRNSFKFCFNKQKYFSGSTKSGAGFTLVELLVVIAIIGLLAVGIFLAVTSARVRSRDARRAADIKQMATALESYFGQCNSYPVVLTPTTIDNSKSLASGTATDCGDNSGTATNGGIGSSTGNTLFISFANVPTPPDGSCLTAGPGGTDGNPYTYTSYQDVDLSTVSTSGDTQARGYTLTFCLGTAIGGYTSGFHTLSPRGVQ